MDTVASSSVEGSFTFDESAERVYAAMLKVWDDPACVKL